MPEWMGVYVCVCAHRKEIRIRETKRERLWPLSDVMRENRWFIIKWNWLLLFLPLLYINLLNCCIVFCSNLIELDWKWLKGAPHTTSNLMREIKSTERKMENRSRGLMNNAFQHTRIHLWPHVQCKHTFHNALQHKVRLRVRALRIFLSFTSIIRNIINGNLKTCRFLFCLRSLPLKKTTYLLCVYVSMASPAIDQTHSAEINRIEWRTVNISFPRIKQNSFSVPWNLFVVLNSVDWLATFHSFTNTIAH